MTIAMDPLDSALMQRDRAEEERDEAREALREYGPHCDWVSCHGIATARGRDANGNWLRGCDGLHLADLTDVCDLHHATALRALARRP